MQDFKHILPKSQHCQRNWDLSKSIDPTHLEIFEVAVKSAPSKQNDKYFRVTFNQNRELIRKVYDLTGTDIRGDITKNPQVLAQLQVIFWSDSDPEEMWSFCRRNDDNVDSKTNENMSVGIASGYLNLVAHMLGYKTGYCVCFEGDKMRQLFNTENWPLLILGIGYPKTNLKHTYTEEDNYNFDTFSKDISVEFLN